jgi:transcriptional regulator with XRE-family HTH domain
MRGGDLILMARRRAGFTQRELADRLGYRQATIARWERGDRQASFEDAEAAVTACGFDLDAHLAREDRSWWPQIAAQLELDPLERVRRLTPPGAADLAGTLELLAAADLPVIVIGEVAGALHGWPLVLGADAVEVCASREASGSVSHVTVTEQPPGTAGYRDLVRSAEAFELGPDTLQVASVLDLLRIADASGDREARRRALAYRAVLDVQRVRSMVSRRGRARGDEERLREWLSQQTPIR